MADGRTGREVSPTVGIGSRWWDSTYHEHVEDDDVSGPVPIDLGALGDGFGQGGLECCCSPLGSATPFQGFLPRDRVLAVGRLE
jgi:hypothetical protein